MTIVARQIKLERTRLGLTQEALAERLGYAARGQVSQWETGRALPDLPALLRLAEIFGCGVEYLVQGAAGWHAADIRSRTGLNLDALLGSAAFYQLLYNLTRARHSKGIADVMDRRRGQGGNSYCPGGATALSPEYAGHFFMQAAAENFRSLASAYVNNASQTDFRGN